MVATAATKGRSPHIRSKVTKFLNRRCLSEGSAKWFHFLAFPISRLDCLKCYQPGFVKDEVYLLSMPVNLNNVKDQIEIATSKTEQALFAIFLAQIRISPLMCAGQQMERTLNFDTARKKKQSQCPLRHCAFNYFVTVACFQHIYVISDNL